MYDVGLQDSFSFQQGTEITAVMKGRRVLKSNFFMGIQLSGG